MPYIVIEYKNLLKKLMHTVMLQHKQKARYYSIINATFQN